MLLGRHFLSCRVCLVEYVLYRSKHSYSHRGYNYNREIKRIDSMTPRVYLSNFLLRKLKITFFLNKKYCKKVHLLVLCIKQSNGTSAEEPKSGYLTFTYENVDSNSFFRNGQSQ